MTKLDDRTLADMDFVLEETCKVFPNGGDHESRRYIAQKLKLSAKISAKKAAIGFSIWWWLTK
jgi:hypothetical protein